MPDVRGDTEEDAIDELQNRGLEVTVRKQVHPDPSQQGRVIDQFPTPGTRVERGDRVEITVAE
jgi:serine/threonine-protein kinase